MNSRVEKAEKELRDKFTQMLTQISVLSNLKVDSSSQNGGSSSNGDGVAHLDAWMQRVTGELKKKLDVYESLLSALRQQVQESRERDVIGASAKISSSAKFIGEANGGGGGGGGAGEGAKNGGDNHGNGTEVAT